MSLAYCQECLERIDVENPDCKNHGEGIVYGEKRVSYLEGYRDAKKRLKKEKERDEELEQI